MKNLQQRLNNICGQLQGIGKMVENDEDCFKVLTQLKAVKSALNSLTEKYMAGSFDKAITKGNLSAKQKICHKYFQEIIKTK